MLSCDALLPPTPTQRILPSKLLAGFGKNCRRLQVDHRSLHGSTASPTGFFWIGVARTAASSPNPTIGGRHAPPSSHPQTKLFLESISRQPCLNMWTPSNPVCATPSTSTTISSSHCRKLPTPWKSPLTP